MCIYSIIEKIAGHNKQQVRFLFVDVCYMLCLEMFNNNRPGNLSMFSVNRGVFCFDKKNISYNIIYHASQLKNAHVYTQNLKYLIFSLG